MIRTRIESHVGVITLDRPDKKNALTPMMLDGLAAAFSEIDSSGKAGAIVLEGEGTTFCSGFDLTLCRENSSALTALLTDLSRAVRAMRRTSIPVVVAAHGAAIAGGCALLGGADFVITHATAKLGYPVVRLGISPAVTAPFLAQSIGGGATRQRLFDSSLIDGTQALAIGLATECLTEPGGADRVRLRAMELAASLAAKPRCGIVATKSWLNELDHSAADAAPDAALRASLSLVGSPEERARLAELWKA